MTSSSVQSSVHSQFATAPRSFVQHNYPLSLTETLQPLTQRQLVYSYIGWWKILVTCIDRIITSHLFHMPFTSGITSAVKKNLMKSLITLMQQIYNILISLPIFPLIVKNPTWVSYPWNFLIHIIKIVHLFTTRNETKRNCDSPKSCCWQKSLRLNAGRT